MINCLDALGDAPGARAIQGGTRVQYEGTQCEITTDQEQGEQHPVLAFGRSTADHVSSTGTLPPNSGANTYNPNNVVDFRRRRGA